MVATTGIERAIQYYHAISGYLQERKRLLFRRPQHPCVRY